VGSNAAIQILMAESPPSDGLVTIASAHSASETIERLDKLLRDKGVQVFARIDHAEGARKVNLPLRSTTVLLFGNPQVGTPLMQSKQTAGIDLPLKALVWEDEAGKVWLTYNRAEYIAARHHIGDHDATITAMNTGLEALLRAATTQ
jgi:uncharacterized protein (DUF302 family)